MAKEGRTGLTGLADASLDVLTQTNNAIERRLTNVEAQQRTDARRRLAVITPGTPFIFDQTPVVGGIQVSAQIELPPALSLDWIKAIYRGTSETVDKNREQEWRDIKQADVDAFHFEGVFDKALDPETTYGLVALIAKGDFPNSQKSRNPDPPDDTTFLTQWTTISFFENDPSKPDLGLVLENKFDDVTKAFDAFVVVRIYAPINGNLTAYTGTVTINGTTAVIGTQSFATQVPPVTVGMLVIVNGQTRKVTNVVGATLTVDVAFKGSASGLALLFGTPHTWATALVRKVIARFRLTDDGTAKPIDQPHDLTEDELAQNSIDFRVNGFVAARKYDWIRNVLVGSISGRRSITPGTAQTFIAGGFTDATAGLPQLTGVGFQFDTTDPYSDKERGTQVVATQPNPPIALDRGELRRFKRGAGTVQISAGVLVGTSTAFLNDLSAGDQVIVSTQTITVTSVTDNTHANVSSSTNIGAGQAYYVSKKVVQEKNLRRAKFHPVTGGQIAVELGGIKTKKLTQQIFRLTIFAQNGLTRDIDDNFTTGNTGEVDGDTAAPGAPPAPDLQEFFGALKCEGDLPATNVNTFKKFRYVMSTSSSPPSSVTNPTVGVDGVLRIKKGPGAVEFQRKTADISSTTFWFYVQALNAVDWGPWSAGTSILGSEITRPLTDVIGTAAPKLSLRLERAATSGTGHGGSGSQFQLDTGASAVDDFYNGMFLHVPSLAANNRVRKVTDYDGANRMCQVAGYSAAPVGALAYEMHAGIEDAGDTSQTGHDTTHLQLSTLANATDGFYVGMSIYVPNQAAGDQIRKIIGYVGSTRKVEFESAVAVASSGNVGYMISAGSFGFAAINPASGIITGVPIRVWLNSDTSTNHLEVIMPVGENAFSTQAIFGEGYRSSNGKRRVTFELKPSAHPSIAVGVPSATFYWRIRLQNLVRDDGSGGFSAWSYFVEGYGSGATPGATYDPSVYVPVEVDFQDPDSYPASNYPQF
jgi:hypothetical protein